MGCGGSTPANVSGDLSGKRGWGQQVRQSRNKNKPNGNLLNLISDANDYTRALKATAQLKVFTSEQWTAFSKDEHDNKDEVKMQQTIELLSQIATNQSNLDKELIIASNLYVKNLTALLQRLRGHQEYVKLYDRARLDEANAETNLRKAKEKLEKIKAQPGSEESPDKASAEARVADLEAKVLAAKATLESTTKTLAEQSALVKADKARMIKQNLYFFNQMQAAVLQRQLDNLKASRDMILKLDGSSDKDCEDFYAKAAQEISKFPVATLSYDQVEEKEKVDPSESEKRQSAIDF